MTNFQRWKELTAQLESPELYIDLGWLFAIATALERRVYYGDLDRPQWCNLYILFVGDPALGKGIVMREDMRLLQYYLYETPNGSHLQDPDTQMPQTLFVSLPNTVIFERLIEVYSKLSRVINIPHPVDPAKTMPYVHASAMFCLEELSSLLRSKRTQAEDVARFLLQAYDCGEFRYSTRHGGRFYLRNMCLNILAGTQVDYVKKAEADGMLGEGLISRFIIAYAQKKRHSLFDYGELTPAQRVHQQTLRDWLKTLSKLFGSIKYEPGLGEWVEAWYKKEDEHLQRYADTKLMLYFARRKDHVKKLAAALHFSESTDMVITRASFERAIDWIRELENSTILLARKTGRNLYYPIQERLVAELARRPKDHAGILRYLAPEMDLVEATSAMNMLEQSKRICHVNGIWYAVEQLVNDGRIATSPDIKVMPAANEITFIDNPSQTL